MFGFYDVFTICTLYEVRGWCTSKWVFNFFLSQVVAHTTWALLLFGWAGYMLGRIFLYTNMPEAVEGVWDGLFGIPFAVLDVLVGFFGRKNGYGSC